MLIDTHCHLHDSEWFTPAQQADFLKEAHESDVQKIVCIGTNPEDSKNARDFAASHANVYWTYGIHPEFANSKMITGREGDYCSFLEAVRSATSEEKAVSARNESQRSPSERRASSSFRGDDGESEQSKDGPEERRASKKDDNRASRPLSPVAIGEIGLDYHYEGYNRSAQIRLFEQMLELAIKLKLPVSLHIREAFDDAFGVLDNFPDVKGVVHSFTGSKKVLQKVLEREFYVGVNGLATYSTLPLPPLEKMLLETDAPFLTPAPFRGKINMPGYVSLVADFLATTLNVPKTLIAEQTTKNATTLFKI